MGSDGDKNLGQEIQNIVQEAVGNMDFKRLNQEINNTVESAIANVKKNISNNQAETQRKAYTGNEKDYKIIRDANGRYQKIRTGTEEMVAAMRQQPARQAERVQPAQRQQPTPYKRTPPLVDNKPAGRISSVVYTLLGGFFGFSFGTAVLVLTIVGFAAWEISCLFVALGLFPFFIGSLALMTEGIIQSKRLQRFRQYVRILHGRTYAMLDEFAATLGKSRNYVRKDVQKMISLRMFPYGRLDAEGTCLILNNETWQQYMALKSQAQQRELEQREQVLQEREQKQLEETDPFQHEVQQALKEGERYLGQIREANEAIPGKEISTKLDNLEMIIRKIFEQLKNHPEKIPEMKKFMEYYLPTTLKLVNAYREFDGQTLAGENINTGKQEIEKTLDTINKAFLNLFDSLFADTAMDISTDISVLQTMLAQEGLTEPDFK